MIPAREDAIFISAVREKGIESIVEWFDRHKQSFYQLGWFYVDQQQEMEELFYRCIQKVYKERSRYKSGTSIDLWVTSIFLDTCRELSPERDDQTPTKSELFKALNHLKDDEKDAVLLIYVKECSQEEAARILRVSVDELRRLLFSGIESVRTQLAGADYSGCLDYRKNYLDYLERTMDRPEKIEFEKHIYHCAACQGDLSTFQETTITIREQAKLISDLPELDDFTEMVTKRLMEKHKRPQNKKWIKTAVVFASVFAFFIGIGWFTGAFRYVYYGMTEEDEQLRAFLQQDIGQRVDLEAESNGVKISITGVVADTFQTLVFYKIEDTKEDNQYVMSYENGLMVENDVEILDHEKYPRNQFPDLKAEMNNKEKNVFYGKVGLRPLNKKNGNIKLMITELIKLSPNSKQPVGFGYSSNVHKTGEWNFEVPVTQQPSVEYALNKKTKIEEIPVRFAKLTVAPTATILEYEIGSGKPGKRIDYVQLDDLEVNNKKVKTDRFGTVFLNLNQDNDWTSFETQFDPLYGEKPNEIAVHFQSAYFTVEESKSVELDVTGEFPQTFEYAGSTITIDRFDVGQPTTFVISDREIKGREYEMFQLMIVGENEAVPDSTEMESVGVYVDRNGVEYDSNLGLLDYEKVEQPRYFVTEQTIRIDGDKLIPKRLDINAYNTTKYLDDVLKIELE